MKESIGSTASLNIVLTFLAIVFAFLAASLSYYKAYKVNNIVTNAIEKYEGYNDIAAKEINLKLISLGYQKYKVNCPQEKNYDNKKYELITDKSGEGICVYIHNNASTRSYDYVITTYMTLKLPIVGNFIKFPINTTTNDIYGCYANNDSYKIGTETINCN